MFFCVFFCSLDDENEIKLQCYLIIVRLTSVSSQLLDVLDQLVEGIKKELKKKVDKTAIAQAQERQLELKRAALRSVVALSAIPGADSNAKFKGNDVIYAYICFCSKCEFMQSWLMSSSWGPV